MSLAACVRLFSPAIAFTLWALARAVFGVLSTPAVVFFLVLVAVSMVVAERQRMSQRRGRG